MQTKNGLDPTLRLSFEMPDALASIEQEGLKINLDTLEEIERSYQQEMDDLEVRLKELAQDAVGDTPINLASPDDRSMLLYSRRVTNKQEWAAIFNLGTERRGATVKPKMRRRMSRKEFNRNVGRLTEVVYKTRAERCTNCLGHGRTRVVKKDGTLGKATRVCKVCGGSGVVYHNTHEVAGFKLLPRTTYDLAAAGFRTDKDTLDERRDDLRGDGREFVESYVRYNALRTYLNTFVEGIKNNVDSKGFIHPEFMQCVTATGRLSSRNPNFQNMPRGSTFAIRKVVESRFPDGYILEGDYSQLEFRVAGFLAGDKRVYADVREGTDVHSYTASIIGCTRQEAKAHTFKPLYGGTTGTEDQKRYYNDFKDKYMGIAIWHETLQEDAVKYREISLPSGRVYAFPDARWTKYGTATHRTAICNYPVQGFATADLLPIALVALEKAVRDANIRSVICNTVHDSIVMDVHPDEKNICIDLMKHAMLSLPFETVRRYGIAYNMPVGIEIKAGKNWLDLHDVKL